MSILLDTLAGFGALCLVSLLIGLLWSAVGRAMESTHRRLID